MGFGGSAVIDFQAFRGLRNEYIVKELAALDLSTGCFTVAFFPPQCELHELDIKTIRTIEWLETSYHHLKWNDGCTLRFQERWLTFVLFSQLYTPTDCRKQTFSEHSTIMSLI